MKIFVPVFMTNHNMTKESLSLKLLSRKIILIKYGKSRVNLSQNNLLAGYILMKKIPRNLPERVSYMKLNPEMNFICSHHSATF